MKLRPHSPNFLAIALVAAAAGFLFVDVAHGAPGSGGDAKNPGLERYLPQDIVGFVTLHAPAKNVEAFLKSDLRKRLEATAIFQHLKSDDKARELFKKAKDLEKDDRSPVSILKDVLGEEAVVAGRLGFPPSVLIVTRSRSEAALKAGLDSIKAADTARAREFPGCREERGSRSDGRDDRRRDLVCR